MKRTTQEKVLWLLEELKDEVRVSKIRKKRAWLLSGMLKDLFNLQLAPSCIFKYQKRGFGMNKKKVRGNIRLS